MSSTTAFDVPLPSFLYESLYSEPATLFTNTFILFVLDYATDMFASFASFIAIAVLATPSVLANLAVRVSM